MDVALGSKPGFQFSDDRVPFLYLRDPTVVSVARIESYETLEPSVKFLSVFGSNFQPTDLFGCKFGTHQSESVLHVSSSIIKCKADRFEGNISLSVSNDGFLWSSLHISSGINEPESKFSGYKILNPILNESLEEKMFLGAVWPTILQSTSSELNIYGSSFDATLKNCWVSNQAFSAKIITSSHLQCYTKRTFSKI